MRRLIAGQVGGLDLVTYGIYYKKYLGESIVYNTRH